MTDVGSLDISYTKPNRFDKAEKPTCPEPAIFWHQNKVGKRLTLAGRYTTPKPWENSLDELVEDCRPATFGRDGKDVLDEKIRKAGAMEASCFATNFNPYDCGIVDAIGRELLPNIVRAGKQQAVDRWGVLAKLYKLNVYSAPSGMFKPHVDTPRGHTHFGSLVVALPTTYEGGQLRVVSKGKETVGLEQPKWDYPPSIRWIAFYSDCEHEVLPVTAGHRITLTYELWVADYLGGLTQPQAKTPGSAHYAIYERTKTMLSCPHLLRYGGVIGYWCAYQYPETFAGTEHYERYLRTLKGVDAAIFAVFRSLGFTVHIKPFDAGQTIGTADQRTRFGCLLSTK
ncbi:hypothetical protein NW755_009793 [Fusarium falciforme]|uniref:Fe2OG dioxygenase domain-containing protein n=1 Tax=Fusarium falciforme TaxID=195108 RepID=A0A9W8UZ28_9HYPO|nr:hypothetical protein NW755_009793 [Fusarium falciforme]